MLDWLMKQMAEMECVTEKLEAESCYLRYNTYIKANGREIIFPSRCLVDIQTPQGLRIKSPFLVRFLAICADHNFTAF